MFFLCFIICSYVYFFKTFIFVMFFIVCHVFPMCLISIFEYVCYYLFIIVYYVFVLFRSCSYFCNMFYILFYYC